MTLRAEIISIGDELTSGQRLDTNSQWLSIQLADLGVHTAFHTTVGDSLAEHVDALRTAARRVEIVVSSGGLGPTADDLTRDAMAEAFASPLEYRVEAMDHIAKIFARRQRPMPERNRVQAMFPKASKIIPNPNGTAPGIDLQVDGGCRFFALPGVPAEMKEMWLETVRPTLIEEMDVGRKRWFYRTLKVFGIGESDVEARLPDLIARDRIPRVGITVSKATITLRIASLATDAAEAAELSRSTEEAVRKALGDLIFGEGEVELDDIVQRRLVEARQSLAVIEYGGASMIGPWMSRHIDGDHATRFGMTRSAWFPSLSEAAIQYGHAGQSATAASNPDDAWAAERKWHGQVAEAARATLKTDWCLLVGPYPTPQSLASPIALPVVPWFIALSGPEGEPRCDRLELGAHPDMLSARLAKSGLDYFRKHARLSKAVGDVG